MTKKEDERKDLLEVESSDRYQTIEEMFKGIFPPVIYYTLLILSAIVTSSGVLLGSTPIIIGGMLITPMLTPILAVALSMSSRSLELAGSMSIRILISLFVVSGIAAVMALIMGVEQESTLLQLEVRTLVLYFMVAVSSGVAATFAWVHKEIHEILPGVAISVSLIPPLVLVGVWASAFEWLLVRFFFLILISNMSGVALGSYIVFKILGFERTAKKVKEETEEVQ